ncbi:MAG: hypothetical protein AAFZ15_32345 [Bacteroidota bacterium]
MNNNQEDRKLNPALEVLAVCACFILSPIWTMVLLVAMSPYMTVMLIVFYTIVFVLIFS